MKEIVFKIIGPLKISYLEKDDWKAMSLHPEQLYLMMQLHHTRTRTGLFVIDAEDFYNCCDTHI